MHQERLGRSAQCNESFVLLDLLIERLSVELAHILQGRALGCQAAYSVVAERHDVWVVDARKPICGTRILIIARLMQI